MDEWSDYHTDDPQMEDVIDRSYIMITYDSVINSSVVDDKTYAKTAEQFRKRFKDCRVYDAHI
jgi:hypothetical protein